MDELKIENATSSESETESGPIKISRIERGVIGNPKEDIVISPGLARDLKESHFMTRFVVNSIETVQPVVIPPFSGAADTVIPLSVLHELKDIIDWERYQPPGLLSMKEVPINLSEMSSDLEFANTSSFVPEKQKEVAFISPISVKCTESTQNTIPKHNPVLKEELAINKPKIEELESWMKRALLNTTKPAILLLTGPTGCGKTTAVQAIATSLNIRVIEWITPMDEYHDVNLSRFPTSNQTSKFVDFLLAGSRYEPIFEPTTKKKLILVEDYPNVFLRNPDAFHDVIGLYFKQGKCPLVFIATDGKKKISLDLFPEKVIKEANVSQIHFNPVAVTFMMKAIDRIATLNRRGDVDMDARKAICSAANGDLRNAGNIWHFRFGDTPRPESEAVRIACPKPKRGRKKVTSNEVGKFSKKEVLPHIDSKDPGYDKLHAVARILYAKREPVPIEGCCRDTDARGYLRTDPETIVSQFLGDSRSIVELAHENYLALFSDIDSVAVAADCLSFSDMIMPDNRMDLEHLQETSFTIAVRGFMNGCNNPITKWYPLKKSRLRDVAEKTERFMQKVTVQYAGSPYSLTTARVDMIPLLTNLEKHKCYNKFEDPRKSPIPHITDESDCD